MDTADDDDPNMTGEQPARHIPRRQLSEAWCMLLCGAGCSREITGLDAVLEAAAYENRLLYLKQRQEAVIKAKRLLKRYRAHSLWQEVAAADERLFEVPYVLARSGGRGSDAGRIDLLFRKGETWHVVDYKSDELRDEDQIRDAVNQHTPQLERYRQAVRGLMQSEPVVLLCFLDAVDAVGWKDCEYGRFVMTMERKEYPAVYSG